MPITSDRNHTIFNNKPYHILSLNSMAQDTTLCLSMTGKQQQQQHNKSSYPFEKIFPVYAMGVSTPHSDSIIVNSVDHDHIWEAVQDEAKSEAEKEPILSSFLYASILSHDCLEQALSFVLSNRLHNPTLLQRRLPLSAKLQSRCCGREDKKCSHSHYRVGSARCSEAAKIGEGILLDHGTGVVIGETAVVGNRVSLMHGVILRGSGKENGDRHPKVGDGALIGACVTVLGNIKIGEGAMIASGSLVLKDVPPHSMMAGTPAKVIGYVDEKDPSLTMNHDATKDFFEYVAVSSYTEGKLNSTEVSQT